MKLPNVYYAIHKTHKAHSRDSKMANRVRGSSPASGICKNVNKMLNIPSKIQTNGFSPISGSSPSDPSEFAEYAFDAFDRDHNGEIDFKEFVCVFSFVS